MSDNFNITILVAPLDWGLGHATRCIPIIKYLQTKGYKVLLAAEGSQKRLLEKEFPTLEILSLKGYRIRYSKKKRIFALKILLQIPKIISTIHYEHQWLKKVVEDHQISAVISDNRYGLYNNNIYSIFITHQLAIQASAKWLMNFIQIFNYKKIQKFKACWIPDFNAAINIAGKLSHPKKLPKTNLHYLGGLSRLEINANAIIKYDFVAVISGPEPQRTMLENKILNGLKNFSGWGLIVRGLPLAEQLPIVPANISIINHLPAKELEQAFNESEFIISRSGYTTVMDIIKLKKKSILIPTSQQTEQEYLAEHLQDQGWAMAVQQKDFDLTKSLAAAKFFQYNLPTINMDYYKNVIDQFLSSL